MKFSFKSKVDINQDLQIVVPNKDIQEQVLIKLKAAQKDSKLKGFRKGKAPMDVVESIYGPEIRQDVLWDLASKTFSKIAQEKDLKIVSRPNLIPEKIEEGKDAKFKATFEVYPEVSLSKMSKISYTNFSCEISNDDLDKTITNLQKRMSQWETSTEASKDGDQVKISFVGKIEGEEFEGGTAEDFTVEIGSKSMIEGFEEGLIGLSAGDNKILELTFPDDYGKSDLASKPVNFETQVKEDDETKDEAEPTVTNGNSTVNEAKDPIKIATELNEAAVKVQARARGFLQRNSPPKKGEEDNTDVNEGDDGEANEEDIKENDDEEIDVEEEEEEEDEEEDEEEEEEEEEEVEKKTPASARTSPSSRSAHAPSFRDWMIMRMR